MKRIIGELSTPQEICRLWITAPDQRTAPVRAVVLPMFRAPIEQYTETLPRRWWQLKAATRIRMRRVQPQTINCRCSKLRVDL